MKDNLDKILRKKYLDVETPRIKLDNLDKRKGYNGYKIAIIMLAVVMIAIATRVINNNKYEQNIENKPSQDIVAKNNDELPTATETIEIGAGTSYASINMDAVISKLDYVAIIKLNKILGYTNYSELQARYTFPITRLEVTIEDTLKGQLSGTVEICKDGGIISMADWEKTLTKEQKERKGYNNMTMEEKENTYINILSSVTMSWPKVEEGNTYLVFLKEDKEIYGKLAIIGFMAEYDQNTDSIKFGDRWTPVKENDIIQRAVESN